VTGSVVAVLADGAYPAGATTLVWDGRNRTGSAAASGVYFVRLDYEKQSLERKILIVR
jgi:flagellar hook assembly protein FlgD